MPAKPPPAGIVPKDALRYFDQKKLKPAFSYLDVWQDEHRRAFTIAKVMETDVLDDMRHKIRRAISEGQSFETFKDDAEKSLARSGWTADAKENQGIPSRLLTIYSHNMRAAHSAGQWDRIQRTKTLRPYLLYLLGPSDRHRPEHAAKEGVMLPADDPFWDNWMPPNGWNCKCHIRQISQLSYDRFKKEGVPTGRRDAEDELRRKRAKTTAPKVPNKTFKNERTGKTSKVPEGIDPAWAMNPGKDRDRYLRSVDTK